MNFATLLLLPFLLLLLIYYYLKMVYEYRRKVYIASYRTLVKGEDKQLFIDEYAQAPGPVPWPILGNLATLGQYEIPFVGLTEMAKIYGNIYSLTLGSTRCLVVNSLDLIREVLNQNGKFFGGRPDFVRFHTLFGGDRGNSLALCDWSNLQQKRRNLARKHCSPRISSSYYAKMSEVGSGEMIEFMNHIKANCASGKDFYIKSLIQQTCANMFSQYMCSTRFDYNDIDFQNIVNHFDSIFWEINQGYAIDFLPWLAPFYRNHLKKIVYWSTEIRKFILEKIIGDRELYLDTEEPEKDFTDALLKSLLEDPDVSRDTIIYMLEDFLGGHSAIGNLVMLCLGHVVLKPEIGHRIQQEADIVTRNGKKIVTLFDIEQMPFTVATIYEVLRYSSSPIVPHVATEDACIAGYGVTKGTLVFINNYELNTSEKYWNSPDQFQPDRFLETTSTEPTKIERCESSDSGIDDIDGNQQGHTEEKKNPKIVQLKKNIPHFLPFSIGKRTCIGQNLVKGFSFIILANIMQQYDVSISDQSQVKMYPACVAVPPDTFPLALTPRSSKHFEISNR